MDTDRLQNSAAFASSVFICVHLWFHPLSARIATMRDPRLEKLSDVLVNYSVGVKPDQLVRISGPPAAMPLIVEVYRKALAAGGHPFVRMSPDETAEIFLKNATDAQLRFLNRIAMFETEKIDCNIGI